LILLTASVGAARADAPIPIGYVELANDPRYDDKLAYAGLLLSPGGRPVAGAEVALEEIKLNGQAFKLDFALEKADAADATGLLAAIERLVQAKDVRIFLLDAPDAVVAAVTKALRDKPVLLFNVSAESDSLRAEGCQANLLHTIPSHAMLMDALTEYLVAKKWREVLVLQGPLPEDIVLTESFARSAKKFGAKLVDVRKFTLGEDPRERDQNNLALLTSNVDYDVVFVADSDGEFGRYLPYATQLPRLVVGSAGLAPVAWHWSFEAYGAAQLTRRFFRHADRQMQSADWAAWVAVRAIGEAVIRTRSTDLAAIAAYLRSDKLNLDGSKGPPLSFRAWDNQLRQPILLADANWVVAETPLPQFQHASNNLDTLGVDKPESKCRL
jgi:ABC transporter substrate binding protein (PQQ-dependent alcohol dehydrogenase system)